MVTFPSQKGPLSTFFRQLGGRSNFFLSLLGLDCFQPQIIHMPKTFWGGKFCSPTLSSVHNLPSQPILLRGDPDESLFPVDPNLLEGTL